MFGDCSKTSHLSTLSRCKTLLDSMSMREYAEFCTGTWQITLTISTVQLPYPDTAPVAFLTIKIQYACGTTNTPHETHMFCLIESINPFTYVVALVQVKHCFWKNEDIQKLKEQCHLGRYTTAEAISRLSVNKLEPTLLVEVSEEVQVHQHTFPSTPYNHHSMYKLCDFFLSQPFVWQVVPTNLSNLWTTKAYNSYLKI